MHKTNQMIDIMQSRGLVPFFTHDGCLFTSAIITNWTWNKLQASVSQVLVIIQKITSDLNSPS